MDIANQTMLNNLFANAFTQTDQDQNNGGFPPMWMEGEEMAAANGNAGGAAGGMAIPQDAAMPGMMPPMGPGIVLPRPEPQGPQTPIPSGEGQQMTDIQA